MTRVTETAASVAPSPLAGAPPTMGIISALSPSILESASLPLPTQTPPSSDPNLTKQEKPDTTSTHTLDIPPPPFVNSINGLRTLSTTLSTFLHRYDELHDHINFIKTSLHSKLKNAANPNQCQTPSTETSSAFTTAAVPETMAPEKDPKGDATNCERIQENVGKPETPGISENPEDTDNSEKLGKPDILKKPAKKVIKKNPAKTVIDKKPAKTVIDKKPEKTDISKQPAASELEIHCEKMNGRDMRKYIAAHISDMDKLRDEIPNALKLAKDPAKLVLESIGRFYLQSSKAFQKGSQQVAGRLASVLILECFVMISSDGIEITKEEGERAAKVAVDWNHRMIRTGGYANTDEVDARGLLLLISGFGIPDGVFKSEDIGNLIKASNVKGISSVLRRSIILVPKLPEVIDWMVKNDLKIEAADIAYTFGLEDKCHPHTILKTFLCDTIKDGQHGSSTKEAMKKQLSTLKSVRVCLTAHKVDPSKFLPGCNINEKIQELQKEIGKLDLEAARKRKVKEGEPSRKQKRQKAKGTLSSHENEDVKSPYNGLTQSSSSSYLDRSAYPGSSVFHAPGPGLSGSVAIQSGASVLTGPYGRTYPDQMVNPTNGWHDNSSLIHKYLDQPKYESGLVGLYSRQSKMSSLESFPGLPGFRGRGGPASDLYSFADAIGENDSYPGSYASGSGSMRLFR